MCVDETFDETVQTIRSRGLRLVIESFVGVPGTGRVALVNESDAPTKVWRMGNQWGDALLSFRGERSALTVHIVRGPQLYTVNVRSTVLIPPGARHYWSFDFGDSTWNADVPFQEWVGPDATLIALYHVDADPDSVAYNVLIADLQSEPVEWRPR